MVHARAGTIEAAEWRKGRLQPRAGAHMAESYCVPTGRCPTARWCRHVAFCASLPRRLCQNTDAHATDAHACNAQPPEVCHHEVRGCMKSKNVRLCRSALRTHVQRGRSSDNSAGLGSSCRFALGAHSDAKCSPLAQQQQQQQGRPAQQRTARLYVGRERCAHQDGAESDALIRAKVALALPGLGVQLNCAHGQHDAT